MGILITERGVEPKFTPCNACEGKATHRVIASRPKGDGGRTLYLCDMCVIGLAGASEITAAKLREKHGATTIKKAEAAPTSEGEHTHKHGDDLQVSVAQVASAVISGEAPPAIPDPVGDTVADESATFEDVQKAAEGSTEQVSRETLDAGEEKADNPTE